jgi:adenylyltransferase/sulfurtransferase
MDNDLHRYHRQMLLPGFGETGQQRLCASAALVLGCGALGSAAADLLARAGVGRLIIVDRDYVELTNLQRQVLFDEQDVAESMPKAQAAKRKLARINSGVEVTAVVDDLNYRNIEHHAAGADILVDGLDNFETRYLVNDFAVRHGVPYVYGGAVGTTGASFAILPHTEGGAGPWEAADVQRATPCLRCLFEEAPPPGTTPTCDTVGVLGPLVTLIAAFEVTEALKILTGNFERVSPSMLNVDLWTNTILSLRVAGAREAGDCPCCRQRRYEFLDGKAGSTAAALCGRDAVQLTHRAAEAPVDLAAVAERLRRHGEITANEYNGKPYELTVFTSGRAIVKGTSEAAAARSVYAKYVGS